VDGVDEVKLYISYNQQFYQQFWDMLFGNAIWQGDKKKTVDAVV
jgi:hypothetical protein